MNNVCLQCIFLNWVSKISKRFQPRPSGKKGKNKWRRFSSATSFQLENYWNPPTKIEGWNPPRKSRCLFCSPTKNGCLETKILSTSLDSSEMWKDSGSSSLAAHVVVECWLHGLHVDAEGSWTTGPVGTKNQPNEESRNSSGFFFIKAESYISHIQFVLVSPTRGAWKKILQWSMGKWYRG